MDAATIETLGRSWVNWLAATNLWALAAVAVVIAFDRVAARHISPGWRMALYIVVLARLIWPGGWASTFALVPGDAAVAVATAPAADPLGVEIASPKIATVGVNATPRWSWGTGALLLHASGTLILLGQLIVGRRRLARIRATACEVRVPGGGQYTTLEHPSAGPMALGIREPVIVVPSVALQLPTHELVGVIRHERAHLRHSDPALQLGLLLTRAVLWPVAAVWLAAAQVRALMEQRADAEATDPLDAAATREYGALLLRVATMGQLTPPAVGLGHSELRSRLRALGRRPRASVPVQAAAVLLAAGASSVLIAKRPQAPIEPRSIAVAESDSIEPARAACLSDRQWSRPNHPQAAALEASFADAQVWVEDGQLERAAAELREVAWLAASIKYGDVAAAAAGQLMSVSLAQGDTEAALGWGIHAAAAYGQAEPSRAAAEFYVARAELLESTGDASGAAAARALADEQRSHCP